MVADPLKLKVKFPLLAGFDQVVEEGDCQTY